MPLSWNEIRQRAITFSREWAHASKENAEAQTFWNEFFQVFGKSRKSVASFEHNVKSLKGSDHRIDLFWAGRLIGESKSRGKDLAHAESQAVGYIQDLINEGREDEVPRYILTTDFARLTVRDLEPENPKDLYDFSADATVDFPLSDLHLHIRRFAFIAGYETQTLDPEDPANIEAAELLANVHDRLEDAGYTGHDLQRFMVRVLFCLFAEDTGIFEPDAFKNFILHHTRVDASDLGPQLAHFFQVLNAPREQRQSNLNADLAELPYVNGKLFEEQLHFASFDSAMRTALLTASGFKWETISPAVFGSLFQSIMQPRERRQIGAHYTSERDILKLIRSLFLDKLTEQLNRCAAPRDYNRFLDHLRTLRFFDPACGCGNFLVIAFRELRRLEMDALNELSQREADQRGSTLGLTQSRIPVSHFYGIEIEEWPALIAEVAMWLMDHQLNNEQFARFGTATPTVPLKDSPRIVHDNALRIDWNTVLPAEQCSYIMGNPPFVGKDKMTPTQRSEVRDAWGDIRGVGTLDYVSAWYIKACGYMPISIEAAFVSTNSICQGEQVGVIWPELLKNGMKINFGHRTFPWTSEARGRASVHVVIVGFGLSKGTEPKRIYDYGPKGEVLGNVEVSNISPYLTDGNDAAVTNLSKPLCEVPRISKGSQPTDGGHLLFTNEEKLAFVRANPGLEHHFRKLLSAREYLNGEQRWCLWLTTIEPKEVHAHHDLKERLQHVKEFREASTKALTRSWANRPGLFTENRQPEDDFILIPRHSSERRDYIPFGFFDPSHIVHDSCNAIPDATLYHFGVLHSAMHMAWVKQVCGRLKSDFRYSAKLVYNNYPWPEPTDKQRVAVEKAAQGVLDAREKHPGATLADLYDPLTMPADLAKAHAALDRAVDRCYRSQPFPDERRRFEHLFALYEQLTAPLTATKKKSRRRNA